MPKGKTVSYAGVIIPVYEEFEEIVRTVDLSPLIIFHGKLVTNSGLAIPVMTFKDAVGMNLSVKKDSFNNLKIPGVAGNCYMVMCLHGIKAFTVPLRISASRCVLLKNTTTGDVITDFKEALSAQEWLRIGT